MHPRNQHKTHRVSHNEQSEHTTGLSSEQDSSFARQNQWRSVFTQPAQIECAAGRSRQWRENGSPVLDRIGRPIYQRATTVSPRRSRKSVLPAGKCSSLHGCLALVPAKESVLREAGVMGGSFGVASKADCVADLFYGTDYHSHLGTVRGGLAVKNGRGFTRFHQGHHQHPVPQQIREEICRSSRGRSGSA